MNCIEAAENSLITLQGMAAEGLLSSLVPIDFFFGLELLQIFLIASALQKLKRHEEHARNCLEILQNLGSAGFPKRLLPEIHFQLQKVGIFNNVQDGNVATGPLLTSNSNIGYSDESHNM